MACIENITTCITQGNDWVLDLTLTEDGVFDESTGLPTTPKNLTSAVIVLDLKETREGVTIASPTVVISDALNGQVRMSLTAAQTELLISEPSDTGSRSLFGAPQITYADGTIEDLFLLNVDVHQSWN